MTGVQTCALPIFGNVGAANAALFAVALLASTDAAMAEKLQAFRVAQTEVARNMTLPPV